MLLFMGLSIVVRTYQIWRRENAYSHEKSLGLSRDLIANHLRHNSALLANGYCRTFYCAASQDPDLSRNT